MLASALTHTALLFGRPCLHPGPGAFIAACVPDHLASLSINEIRATDPFQLDELVRKLPFVFLASCHSVPFVSCTQIEELEAEALNFREANDGNPSLQLSRLLAVAHTSSGDVELAAPHAFAALTEAGQAAAQPPPSEDPQADAEMHFCLGLEAEKRDAQDEALDAYEKAVELDPECWRALFHVGKISLQFGWVADSVDYFKKVRYINPSHQPTQRFLTLLEESGVDAEDLGTGSGGGDGGGDGPEDDSGAGGSGSIDMPPMPPGVGGGIEL